ncbi:MAG: polysaccharide deacetylase family protein [Anaerolineae bacterium]|nr:polysaccharide deacetylase family protein [Anaerolineae bacterium]
MPPRRLHTLSFFTTIGLMALVVFGRIAPATPREAEAQRWAGATRQPGGTPWAPATHALLVTPTQPLLLPASPATPATTTPTVRPSVTATPTARPTRPTRPTATPTPDFSPLTARLKKDTALQTALCQPDMKLVAKDGQIVVPILLYHFVGRTAMESAGRSTSRYNVTAADFELQLAMLYRLGYQTVSMRDVGEALSGTLTLPARPVVITVDDGWVEQYTNLYPLLKKYAMTATFYIPSTYPVGGRFVTWEQVQEMVKGGMEIGSHTCSHRNLAGLWSTSAWFELNDSKKTLEEKLGVTITTISYPYGNHTASTLALAQEAGYLTGVTMGAIPTHSEASRYRLTRAEILGTRPLDAFLNYLPWRGQGLDVCGGPPPARPTPYGTE